MPTLVDQLLRLHVRDTCPLLLFHFSLVLRNIVISLLIDLRPLQLRRQLVLEHENALVVVEEPIDVFE